MATERIHAQSARQQHAVPLPARRPISLPRSSQLPPQYSPQLPDASLPSPLQFSSSQPRRIDAASGNFHPGEWLLDGGVRRRASSQSSLPLSGSDSVPFPYLMDTSDLTLQPSADVPEGNSYVQAVQQEQESLQQIDTFLLSGIAPNRPVLCRIRSWGTSRFRISTETSMIHIATSLRRPIPTRLPTCRWIPSRPRRRTFRRSDCARTCASTR